MRLLKKKDNPFPKYRLRQESRDKLFQDFVELKGDAAEIVLRHEARLEETQKTEIKWGFRPLKWMQDRHGESKAAKLVKRKQELGLFLVLPSLSSLHVLASM